MFESIDDEVKKLEGSEPLQKRIAGYLLVSAITGVVLGILYIAIVYLG